jgi:lysozyme
MPLFFIVILSTINLLRSDDCADWFDNLKIKKDQNCVLNCTIAPTGMGTFVCTNKCKDLCKGKTIPSGMKMNISEKGVTFISSYEQFKENKYYDVGGNETIGYGHLVLEGENYSKPITREEAKRLLEADLKFAISAVNESVKSVLKQNEFDALVSLTFNIGVGAFKSSTILKIINSGKIISPETFNAWNKVNGKISQGLSNRRQDELELYRDGDYEIIKGKKGVE